MKQRGLEAAGLPMIDSNELFSFLQVRWRIKFERLRLAADPSFSKGLIGINRGDGSGWVNLRFFIFFNLFFSFLGR